MTLIFMNQHKDILRYISSPWNFS